MACPLRGLLLLLSVCSCTKSNPLNCTDGICSDEALPFCDVDGELGGTPGVCIAVDCKPGEVAACRDNSAVTCNALGTNYDLVSCTGTCDATNGGCIDCSSNTDCISAQFPTCDLVDHQCRACRSDADCASDVCDAEAGACVPTMSVIYVSSSGSESVSCGSPVEPCTLSKAFARVGIGAGIIRMRSGTYLASTGQIIVGSGQNVSLHGDGATLVASTGTGWILVKDSGVLSIIGLKAERTGPEATLIATDSSGVSNPSLTLTRAKLVGTGVAVNSGKVTIRDTEITMNEPGAVRFGRAALYVSFSNGRSKVVVERTRFVDTTHSSFAAIASYDTTLEVINSVFIGFTNDFAHSSEANGGARENTDVSYSTFYDTPANCGPATSATRTYSNNIFFSSTGSDATSGAGCSHSFDLAYPQLGVVPNGDHILKVDPKFEDGVSGRLGLLAGSPAIDAADPASVSNNTDFVGTVRPQGPRRDLGAFERKAGSQ